MTSDNMKAKDAEIAELKARIKELGEVREMNDGIMDFLSEVFRESERPDKVRVYLGHDRTLSIVYEDLDDGWCEELRELLEGQG